MQEGTDAKHHMSLEQISLQRVIKLRQASGWLLISDAAIVVRNSKSSTGNLLHLFQEILDLCWA